MNLPLSNSPDFFTIDDEDYPKISAYRWGLDQAGYVRAFKGKEKIYVHRLIMEAGKGENIDHVSGVKKDNRRSNLRKCTQAQNIANSRKQKNTTSVFKGVTWDKARNKFLARLGMNGKGKNLGRYEKEVDAAKAYNEAAFDFYGEFARLNVIPQEST